MPLSAAMMLAITHLPAVGIWGVAPLTAALMATNSSRMVTATSLVIASIEPRHRGGFVSIKSSVQHMACGLGTRCAGLIVEGGAGEPLRQFGVVGAFAAGLTIASLLLASRVRQSNADGEQTLPASDEGVRTPERS